MFLEDFEPPWQRERLLESLESYRRGLADAPLLRKWSAGSFDRLRMSGSLADAGDSFDRLRMSDLAQDERTGWE